MGEISLPPLRIGSHSAPVIPEVLEEHLEEVAFLSIQRRKLLFSRDVSLTEFLPHDRRISAHWDALALAGEASSRIAQARLAAFDPWEVYASIRVWLELGGPQARDVAQCLEEAAEADGGIEDDAGQGLLPSWREALRRMPPNRLEDFFPPEGGFAGSSGALSVLVYAWGAHGMIPEESLASHAFHSDPSVRWSAARALGWGPGRSGKSRLFPALLGDPEPSVSRAALWSQVLRDPMGGAGVARKRLESGDGGVFSARVLGLVGLPSDAEILAGLAGPGDLGLAAIRSLGDLGSLAGVDPLINLLGSGEEEVEAAAAEALETTLGNPSSPPAMGGDEPGGGADSQGGREAWAQLAMEVPAGARLLRGRPFPLEGPAFEEPMEGLWRAGLLFQGPDVPWLRAEVPDGFFGDFLSSEAVPGE